ncbi:RES family NAD+ phosphorylase [Pelagibacterium halotolerans]|uniref:RES family NAD+ phosphorylase n=1 Tax=Pelagibacterium halotolerans TaxID=531813 RepID=UPI00384EECE2
MPHRHATTRMSLPFDTISGTFFRIAFARDTATLLDGAKSAEGRFHRAGQRALYVSSREDWAGKAIEVYINENDPQRIVAPLYVDAARIVDLRNVRHCAAWGLEPTDAAIPWRPQREMGVPATSWTVSDRIRNGGADGMIYTARTAPSRWHLVLFAWNSAERPRVTLAGAPRGYRLPG